MNLVHHFQWTSSVRCPHHHQAVNVIVDQAMTTGKSHIEIAGCCGEFTGLVERRLRSVVKASFHTLIRNSADTVAGEWVSRLPVHGE